MTTRKIHSRQDLQELRDRLRNEIAVREGPQDFQITVHMSTCGIAAGARDVLTQLAAELEEAGIENVTLRHAGCLGLCDREPMMTVRDRNETEVRYGNLDRKRVHEIVQEHVIGGQPVDKYVVGNRNQGADS